MSFFRFFINTFAIAAMVALLNRIETKRKYKEDKKQFQAPNYNELRGKVKMEDFMLKLKA